jgi:hypothetical protein
VIFTLDAGSCTIGTAVRRVRSSHESFAVGSRRIHDWMPFAGPWYSGRRDVLPRQGTEVVRVREDHGHTGRHPGRRDGHQLLPGDASTSPVSVTVLLDSRRRPAMTFWFATIRAYRIAVRNTAFVS